MPSLVENKKHSPRVILFTIIIIIFLKTTLSGNLMAKGFLLVLLSEPQSAVCMAKGMKVVGVGGGRKAIITHNSDKDPSSHFTKYYVL